MSPTAAPTPDHVLRWACRRCVVTRTGSMLPAQVSAPIHDNVCLRHNLWIGKNIFAPAQPLNLSRTPDVIRAQRQYCRLRRRHGPTITSICYDATGKPGADWPTPTTGSPAEPNSSTTWSESRDRRSNRTRRPPD